MSSNQPRVFIPHVPSRYDHVAGLPVPSLDLNPAHQFGEFVTLNGPCRLLNEDDVNAGISAVADGMAEFRAQDYILCVGDVALVAAAIAYAADGISSPVKILRWNRETKRYDVMEVSL